MDIVNIFSDPPTPQMGNYPLDYFFFLLKPSLTYVVVWCCAAREFGNENKTKTQILICISEAVAPSAVKTMSVVLHILLSCQSVSTPKPQE